VENPGYGKNTVESCAFLCSALYWLGVDEEDYGFLEYTGCAIG